MLLFTVIDWKPFFLVGYVKCFFDCFAITPSAPVQVSLDAVESPLMLLTELFVVCIKHCFWLLLFWQFNGFCQFITIDIFTKKAPCVCKGR